MAQLVETLTAAGAMDYTIVVGATASELAPAAVHRALFRLRHGRILHGSGQGRADRLRRPEQARGGLPRPVAAHPPSAGTRGLSRRRVLPAQPPAGARRTAGPRSTAAVPSRRCPSSRPRRATYPPTSPPTSSPSPTARSSCETELFHSGVMPAVNPGISVSPRRRQRADQGHEEGRRQPEARSTASTVSCRALRSSAPTWTPIPRRRLAQGERIVEVLKQNRNHPIAVEDQVCIFYAVTHGFLKDVAVNGRGRV